MSKPNPVALADLFEYHGLSADTILFRATLPEHLRAEEGGEGHVLAANPDPVEGIVDVHGSGHIVVASTIGPGVALTETQDNEWMAEDRILVSVRLGDVIDQGGLVYPVSSVITDKVWFCTLPEGGVRAVRVSKS